MTENEAIEYLKRLKEDYFQPEKISSAFDVATDALKEIQKYRAIGTIEFLTDMKSHYVEVLSDLRQYQNLGTVEEIKDILSTISENQDDVDESGISTGLLHTLLDYAKYKKIGTIEECREAREKVKGYCEPRYLGQNAPIGCRIGECKYGNIIRSYQKFCDECGIK